MKAHEPTAADVPPFVAGMILRIESKLRENCKRGRRHGPYYINGRRFRRNKVRKIMREWNRWAAKHQRLRIGIQRVTGFWWPMPNDCNTI